MLGGNCRTQYLLNVLWEIGEIILLWENFIMKYKVSQEDRNKTWASKKTCNVKTFKYKLYNSKKNHKLDEVISLSGRAYNYSLAMSKKHYRLFGKSLKHMRLQKHMTKKKDIFDLNLERTYIRFEKGEVSAVQFDQIVNRMYWRSGYMKDIPSQALQQITERVKNAYTLFHENRNLGKKSSPPKFDATEAGSYPGTETFRYL